MADQDEIDDWLDSDSDDDAGGAAAAASAAGAAGPFAVTGRVPSTPYAAAR